MKKDGFASFRGRSSPVEPRPVGPTTVAPGEVGPADVGPAAVAPGGVPPSAVAPNAIAPGTRAPSTITEVADWAAAAQLHGLDMGPLPARGMGTGSDSGGQFIGPLLQICRVTPGIIRGRRFAGPRAREGGAGQRHRTSY